MRTPEFTQTVSAGLPASAETPQAPVFKCLFGDFPYAEMVSPKVLFRSVSPAELHDILSTGMITGGSNRFNPFDPRREVFFCETISNKLIGQGEEISRRVENALADHPYQKNYEEAVAKVKQLRQDNAALYGSIMPPKTRNAVNKAEKDVAAIRAAFRVMLMQDIKVENEANGLREFTSAVLVTSPLSGGRHYSKNHVGGKSGMGEFDEYGFDPGAVKLGAIVRIDLMKKNEIVRTVMPEDFLSIDVQQPAYDLNGAPVIATKKARARRP